MFQIHLVPTSPQPWNRRFSKEPWSLALAVLITTGVSLLLILSELSYCLLKVVPNFLNKSNSALKNVNHTDTYKENVPTGKQV